jgi:hypothetical protein
VRFGSLQSVSFQMNASNDERSEYRIALQLIPRPVLLPSFFLFPIRGSPRRRSSYQSAALWLAALSMISFCILALGIQALNSSTSRKKF